MIESLKYLMFRQLLKYVSRVLSSWGGGGAGEFSICALDHYVSQFFAWLVSNMPAHARLGVAGVMAH